MAQTPKRATNGNEDIAPVVQPKNDELSPSDLDQVTGGKGLITPGKGVNNGDPCDGSEFTH